MNICKKITYIILGLFVFSFNMWAENNSLYTIHSVTYKIQGITREYPLTRAVPIDTKRIFTSLTELEKYLDKLEQQEILVCKIRLHF